MQLKQRKQLARKGALGLKQACPYKVLQIIGPETYKLELPPGFRIHPNFNRRFLLPYHCRADEEPTLQTGSFNVELDLPQVISDAPALAHPRQKGEPAADPPNPP